MRQSSCLNILSPEITVMCHHIRPELHILYVIHHSHISLSFHSGDSSFFLRTWLMTPLRVAETPAEYRYNRAHSATHSVIEKTLRALCSRFRCLDGSKGALQYSPEKSSHIILACCVLHNISLEHGMDVWSSPVTGPIEQSPEDECELTESLDLEADRIRQELMLTHFS